MCSCGDRKKLNAVHKISISTTALRIGRKRDENRTIHRQDYVFSFVYIFASTTNSIIIISGYSHTLCYHIVSAFASILDTPFAISRFSRLFSFHFFVCVVIRMCIFSFWISLFLSFLRVHLFLKIRWTLKMYFLLFFLCWFGCNELTLNRTAFVYS